MGKIIYISRHAQPVVLNGQKTGLSVVGQRQAKALAKALRLAIPTTNRITVVSSTSQRNKETAESLGEQFSVTPMTANIRFEHADRLVVTDVQSKYTTYTKNHRSLGIESPEAYTRRLLDLVQSLKADVVIVVANEVNIRVVLQILGGETYNKPIRHASCYRLLLDDSQKAAKIERIR